MKLGISCNALGHSGGFERYARDLVNGFAELGVKPAFFARKIDRSLKEASLAELAEISVRGIPNKLRDSVFSWRLKKRKSQLGVDCLIGCNRVTSADIAVCGGTHRGYLKAIGRTPRWTDKLQISLEETHYKNAAYVVAHSQLMARQLHELYGLDNKKIRQIYPPVDAAQFSAVNAEQRNALREKFNFKDNVCTFMFASTSHERKGYPLLEQFFSQTQFPVQLVVAGRSIPKAHEKIRYLGYVQSMPDLYRAVDYTILASSYEPFGLVAVESALCGTPVCLSEDIGASEVLSANAKISFEKTLASLDAAVEKAAKEKTMRRSNIASAGLSVLTYDCGVVNHCKQLLDLCETMQS